MSMAESPKAHTPSKTAPNTLASGWMACATAMAHNFGLMVLVTMACGRMTRRMGRESWCTLTAMSMKDTWSMTRRRATERTNTQMGPIMRESGSMISSMGRAWKAGQMVQDTKATMKRERKRDKEG